MNQAKNIDEPTTGDDVMKRRLTPFPVLCCIYLLLALVLLPVPLLNTVGYEFSAFMGIAAGFGGGFFTLALFRKKIPDAEQLAPIDYLRFLLNAAVQNMLALLLPVIVITANALFVKNCNMFQGLAFVFLIPCVTVLFSIALSGLIAVIVAHAKTVYAIIAVILLLSPVIHTYFEPQLYAYNVFFGYFPGFSYDELLLITPTFILFRILTLCAALLFLVCGAAVVSATARRENVWRKLRSLAIILTKPRYAVTAIPLIVILAGSYYFRHELSFESSVSYVQKVLGAKYSTQHFDIYYSRSTYTDTEINRIAGEHEYRYMQIIGELRTAPLMKIQSYIYPSADVKKQLLGTATTDISKPWMREIHVSANSIDATLKHELVHIIAGRFGMPFLAISPRMGLVEGLAVAVDGDRGERTLHQYVAAMKEFGIEYNIEKLLSYSGFMSQAPGKSYVVCGSFVRFLLDHYGIERFKHTYRTGSFEAGYGRSMQSLIGEWDDFLSKIKIPDSDEAHVRYEFRRLPVFQKTCARVTAEWIGEAGKKFREKNYTVAGALYRHAYDETGNDDALLGYLQSEFRLGEYDSVMASFPSRHRPPLMPLAELLVGDASMMKGDSVQAARSYEALLAGHILRSYDELAAIRLTWLARPHQYAVMQHFYRTPEDSLRIDILRKLLLTTQSDRVTESFYRYLLLRLYVNERRYAGARNLILEEIDSFSDPIINYSAEVLRATVFEHLKEWEKAKLHYWRALNYTSQEAEKSRIEERIELCSWFERHKDF